MKLLALTAFSVFLVSCSQSPPPLETVQDLDLNRYDGEWHEIARLPNRFEQGLVAAKATYGVGLNGPLSIRNEGLKANGQMSTITGSANVVGKGKLKVRFFDLSHPDSLSTCQIVIVIYSQLPNLTPCRSPEKLLSIFSNRLS